MRLFYLIGVPGVGKTTLMRALLRPYDGVQMRHPIAHLCYLHKGWHRSPEPHAGKPIAIQLGADEGVFGGTDRLGMAVQPKAIAFVQSRPCPLLLGEGDRLANLPFLRAAQAHYDVTLVLCTAADDVLQKRREGRPGTQSESWRKGRATKVSNLWDAWDGAKIGLDLSVMDDPLLNVLRHATGL